MEWQDILKGFCVLFHKNTSTTFYLAMMTLVSCYITFLFRLNEAKTSLIVKQNKSNKILGNLILSIAVCRGKDAGFEISRVPSLYVLIVWSWTNYTFFLRFHFRIYNILHSQIFFKIKLDISLINAMTNMQNYMTMRLNLWMSSGQLKQFGRNLV